MSRSDSAISCSRKNAPSARRKPRTAPGASCGVPFSMRLSATNGVHAGRPLKSRTTAQTWPAGAFTTDETKTLGKAPSVVVLAGGRLVALRFVLEAVPRDRVEIL